MQAVILAGGLGTRLREVSGDVPKPMVPVNGEPFLLHQLRMLLRHGFSDFLFLLSYRSQVIIEFLSSFVATEGEGCRVEWSIEPEPMGTAGAVRLALSKLREDFFLLNGDSYLDMDYEGMAEEFSARGCDALLAVYDNADNTDVLSNVLVVNGVVVRYERDAGAEMSHVDAGVLALKRSVVSLIPESVPSSMDGDVYPMLYEQGGMHAYLTERRFFDIGTPQRLREFEACLRREEAGMRQSDS